MLLKKIHTKCSMKFEGFVELVVLFWEAWLAGRLSEWCSIICPSLYLGIVGLIVSYLSLKLVCMCVRGVGGGGVKWKKRRHKK